MPSVLITGANRGIGLEFARQYAADGWNVVATARQSSPELDALGVRVETFEMRDLDAVAGFGERIDTLDLLIANAGVYGPRAVTGAEDARGWAASPITIRAASSPIARPRPHSTPPGEALPSTSATEA